MGGCTDGRMGDMQTRQMGRGGTTATQKVQTMIEIHITAGTNYSIVLSGASEIRTCATEVSS